MGDGGPETAEQIFAKAKEALSSQFGSCAADILDGLLLAVLADANIVMQVEATFDPLADRLLEAAAILVDSRPDRRFSLSPELAAEHGGRIGGRPGAAERSHAEGSGAIPLDTETLVFEDLALIDGSTLAVTKGCLGVEFGGGPRTLWRAGKTTEMPSLAFVGATIDPRRRPAYRHLPYSNDFVSYFDIGVTLDDATVDTELFKRERVQWFDEREGRNLEFLGAIRATLGPESRQAFRRTAGSVGTLAEDHDSDKFADELGDAFEELGLGFQGALMRTERVARAISASRSAKDMAREDYRRALAFRRGAYEALTGRAPGSRP